MHHYFASQAPLHEPAATPACAFGVNGTTLVAVSPVLPSAALTACLCSAMTMSVVHQHRTHGRPSTAVTANRTNPFTSIIAVGLARSHRCRVATAVNITACYRSHPTLIVHSQAFSSMRALLRLGCAMGVPRGDPHGCTAPPSIEGRSVAGYQSTTSGASVASTPRCQYPLCGQLAVGSVVAGRTSDRGPRRAVTTATLTLSGHCAACCAFRTHNYGGAVGEWHWRCE